MRHMTFTAEIDFAKQTEASVTIKGNYAQVIMPKGFTPEDERKVFNYIVSHLYRMNELPINGAEFMTAYEADMRSKGIKTL